MEEEIESTKQAQITRLLKLQKALLMPDDQQYHNLLEEQVTALKAAIPADRPLDDQIKGLEAALVRNLPRGRRC